MQAAAWLVFIGSGRQIGGAIARPVEDEDQILDRPAVVGRQ